MDLYVVAYQLKAGGPVRYGKNKFREIVCQRICEEMNAVSEIFVHWPVLAQDEPERVHNVQNNEGV